MKPQGELLATFMDLEIEFDDMFENRAEFSKKVLRKARELSAQLDRKTPLAEVEREFKQKAYRNAEAKEEAEEIFREILGLISDRDPEVLANLLTMIGGLESTIENEVSGMAIREAHSRIMSKKHIHMMYQRLQKGYEIYVKFCKMMHNETYPLIPSKPGNYADTTAASGIKIYRFFVETEDGELMFQNPWGLGKFLGIEVKFYMDMYEMIVANNGELKGHKIRIVEVPR